MKKKQGISKQQWLEWLSDEPPTAAVQQEIRRDRVQHANRYQPRPLASQPPPAETPTQQPAAQQHPATPTAQQTHQQSHNSSQDAPTVSIQIHVPGFNGERFKAFKRNLKHKPVAWWQLLRRFVSDHRRESVTTAVIMAVILVGVFVPPLFFGGDKAKQTAQGGSAGSSNAGAATGYEKPPFTVVTPSTKTRLATPDGTHSAYDGKKNTFSFSDSLKGNGIIVSQQPVPAQFKDGPEAAAKIASQLTNNVSNSSEIETLFGTAYVVTNTKYNSQSVVINIRDLVVFLQSAHRFSDTEWTQYINALQ